jgi:hypothetical protein
VQANGWVVLGLVQLGRKDDVGLVEEEDAVGFVWLVKRLG